MLAVIVSHQDKAHCVINGKLIGRSVHPDYFEFHWKAADSKALREHDLTKFVHVKADGALEFVIEAAALEAKGVNFKSAPRSTEPLTEAEQETVNAACLLALQPPPAPAPKPVKQAAEPKPAEAAPPAQITAAAAATGLEELQQPQREEALALAPARKAAPKKKARK